MFVRMRAHSSKSFELMGMTHTLIDFQRHLDEFAANALVAGIVIRKRAILTATDKLMSIGRCSSTPAEQLNDCNHNTGRMCSLRWRFKNNISG